MNWQPKTRGGHEYRIIEGIERNGGGPIGAVLSSRGWIHASWDNDGGYCSTTTTAYDLLPAPREWWVFLDDDGNIHPRTPLQRAFGEPEPKRIKVREVIEDE